MSDLTLNENLNQTNQGLFVHSENIFKKYCKIIGVIVVLSSSFFILLNGWIDPLQFYRKSSYSPYLSGYKRSENPGLAKHYDYDTVVVGTSVSENFRAKPIKENLGFNSMNFAMQGASSYEQSLMLQLALRTGKVKNVIGDIHYEYLRGNSKWVVNYTENFPAYLYDKNPLNEIYQYLLNIDTTKRSFKILFRCAGFKTYHDKDLEEFYTWDTKRKFGKASVKKAWEVAKKQRAELPNHAPEYALTNLNSNFDANFLQIIKQHPEVMFHLYFPPYTPGYYVNLQAASPEIFQNMLDNKKYIFEQTLGLKNVQLFDFQIMPSTIFKIENYCDSMHFNSEINQYIIESISAHRHLATDSSNDELKLFLNGLFTSDWMKEISP